MGSLDQIFHKVRLFGFVVLGWLAAAMRLQFILFLVAMPILVWWGLPMSAMSLVGNLCFTPCATFFLSCSMLWFFCCLTGIPLGWITVLTEWSAHWWLWLLSQGSPKAMFVLPRIHPVFLWCIPLSVLVVMYAGISRRHGIWTEILVLFCLSCGWCSVLRWCGRAASREYIQHGVGSLCVIPRGKKLVLLDKNGILRNMPSLDSWIQFNLLPRLAMVYGVRSCDEFIIAKPTVRRMDAAVQFVRKGAVKLLRVPSETLKQPWWQAWREGHADIKVCIGGIG